MSTTVEIIEGLRTADSGSVSVMAVAFERGLTEAAP